MDEHGRCFHCGSEALAPLTGHGRRESYAIPANVELGLISYNYDTGDLA